MNKPKLSEQEIDRVVDMAWEDRTPFEAIFVQFGLTESDVITLMRKELKPSSWRLWRERAKKVSHKHSKKNPMEMNRLNVQDKN